MTYSTVTEIYSVKTSSQTRQRQFLTMKFLPKKEGGPGRAPAVELHNRYGFRIDIRLKSNVFPFAQ